MVWFSNKTLSKEKAQALLLKGVQACDLKKIDKALEAGADINYIYDRVDHNHEPGTPNFFPFNVKANVILVAVFTKHEDIALALLERGADPSKMV